MRTILQSLRGDAGERRLAGRCLPIALLLAATAAMPATIADARPGATSVSSASVVQVALAGCAPKVAAPVAATPEAGAEAPGTRCDAGAAAALVGRQADASEAEAQRLSGARTVRRYTTGVAVTMDYRPDRLNVETNADGTIVKLSCG